MVSLLDTTTERRSPRGAGLWVHALASYEAGARVGNDGRPDRAVRAGTWVALDHLQRIHPEEFDGDQQEPDGRAATQPGDEGPVHGDDADRTDRLDQRRSRAGQGMGHRGPLVPVRDRDRLRVAVLPLGP